MINKKQALTVFVAELNKSYNILVKSQCKSTLKETYQVALKEEKELLA